MKALVTLLMLAIAALCPAFAEQVQVRLDIKYEGVDAKWFADLSAKARKTLKPTEGIYYLPAVTAKDGEKAIIKVVEEYRAGETTSARTVPCGVIVDCSPEVKGRGIRIVGKSVLRRVSQKAVGGKAAQFAVQEVPIDLEIEDGVSASIDLTGGGQMHVRATLVDVAGRPLRNPNKPA